MVSFDVPVANANQIKTFMTSMKSAGQIWKQKLQSLSTQVSFFTVCT